MQYDQIPFTPFLIAAIVLDTVYTGQDISTKLRNQKNIDKVESLRQNMSVEDRVEFANMVDKRCRKAFEIQAEWFMNCVRSKNNKGRDQLYVWVYHWMTSYLTNKENFIANS